MGKLEFLDALKRAMAGLPPELQAKTLAYYEQRFVDAAASGRAETDVAAELGEPKKIAMTLRANTHLQAFAEQKNPANLVRMLVSALGLAIFNLFMVVPALVYAALLATMVACALAFYVAGIAITAGSMAGTNELVLDGPLRQLIIDEAGGAFDQSAQTTIVIGENGIHISQDRPRDKAAAPADEDADQAGGLADSRVVQRAESVAGHGIRISTDMDAGSRVTGIIFGLTMVVGAIVLFLLSLVVTRYTIIGIKRYLHMNLALLRGH
ncbi:MAG: DUF1700 domain-containing protein [Massilia sp.]